MSTISFADVVHHSVSFNREIPYQALVLDLIDTPWMQRLREISQTANTRLLYMFSEHSRFGHSVGVGFLACQLIDKLLCHSPAEVAPWAPVVSAAALLHDIGHLAPGSHIALRAWFPQIQASHEALAARIVTQDEGLRSLLSRYDPTYPKKVAAVLMESPAVPPWTWEIISGGGWNVDRGNWCVVDSILGGVSYGRYNIPALTESIVLTSDGHLALQESRLDAMMHFAISRHAMYRQVYQHRVLLAIDTIIKAIAQRARELGPRLGFADAHMQAVLNAAQPEDLELETIFWLREAWWRYHIYQWQHDRDPILADLAARLINRRLFKTFRVYPEDNEAQLVERSKLILRELGYDPNYYLHKVSTSDMLSGDTDQSMRVQLSNGELRTLPEADPFFNALMCEYKPSTRSWLTLPAEAKQRLEEEFRRR